MINKLEKDLQALNASIEHWKDNLLLDKPNLGSSSCALCRIYHPSYKRPVDDQEDNCNGCPIAAEYDNYCKRTSYNKIYNANDTWQDAKRQIEYINERLERINLDNKIDINLDNKIELILEEKRKWEVKSNRSYKRLIMNMEIFILELLEIKDNILEKINDKRKETERKI